MRQRELLMRLSQLNVQRPAPPALPPGAGGPKRRRAAAALPEGQEVQNDWGRHWLIEQDVDQVWPGGRTWVTAGPLPASRAVGLAERGRDELRRFREHFPEGVIFLDLETCGFAGAMIFLVGLLHRCGERTLLTQLLARDYAEEKPMLQTFWRMASGKRVLVTFNGKSFDWPMVHDRSTLHHLGCDPRIKPAARPQAAMTLVGAQGLTRSDARPELAHCDLLHHARRLWKHRLPNCRLQTLEQFVCGRRRTGDIPGRDIPEAYRDFVRSRDARRIRAILHHNALDLVTLLQLALRVAD